MDMFFWFLVTDLIVAAALGTRVLYWGYKLRFYFDTQYPEGSKEPGWYGFEPLEKLFAKHGIEDPELIHLIT
jgi:hypothetical protein